jgi:hypothetical protein
MSTGLGKLRSGTRSQRLKVRTSHPVYSAVVTTPLMLDMAYPTALQIRKSDTAVKAHEVYIAGNCPTLVLRILSITT